MAAARLPKVAPAKTPWMCLPGPSLPDFDQVWSTPGAQGLPVLPDEGKGYCLPAAVLNWIVYINGVRNPGLLTWPAAGQILTGGPAPSLGSDAILFGLADLAAFTQTTAGGGTDLGDAVNGLQKWLVAHVAPDRQLPYQVVGLTFDEDCQVTPDVLARWVATGAMSTLMIGWYRLCDGTKDHYWRDGGHFAALADYWENHDHYHVSISDSSLSTDGDLLTQAPFSQEPYKLHERSGTFNGGVATLPGLVNYPSEGHASIDGLVLIKPAWAATALGQGITLHLPDGAPVNFVERPAGATTHQRLYDTGPGDIHDLAFDPLQPSLIYTKDGSASLWSLDLASEQSTPICLFDEAPRFVVVGGVRSRIFVATERAIFVIDRTGRVLSRVAKVDFAIGALAFDDVRRRLLCAGRDGRAWLFPFADDATLGKPVSLDLDMRTTDGRISIDIDPRDGRVLYVQDGDVAPGDDDLVEARRPDGWRMVANDGAPVEIESLRFDGDGSLFAVAHQPSGRQILQWDPHGRPVERSLFSKASPGSLLAVSRSAHNWDRSKVDARAWRSVLPRRPR